MLGDIFNSEYIFGTGLLSEEFDPSEIYVYSTDKNYTLASAQAFLFGLYSFGSGPHNKNEYDMCPPFNISKEIEKHNIYSLPMGYLPIPVHSTNKTMDSVF